MQIIIMTPDYIHGQITEDTERRKGVGEGGNDGGASWAGGGGAGWNSDGMVIVAMVRWSIYL